MPVKALSELRVRGIFMDWRDSMADKPRVADYAWSTLARLMSFAMDRGKIPRNPCARGGRLYTARRNEAVWSEDHLRKLFLVSSLQVAAAVMFALWTGQRQGDCLAAKWTDIAGNKIRVKQAKTGRPFVIPIGAPLAAVLATLPRTAETILTNSRGESWTSSGFRASYRKAFACAGIIEDLNFNDLRGTAVTRMALAGCPVPEIAAVTGHSLATVGAMLDRHYLGGQVDLAEQGFRRLENRHDISQGPQTGLQTGGDDGTVCN